MDELPLELLAVEDEEVDRVALRRRLSQSGLATRLEEARCLEAAQHLLSSRSFDLVLLDNHLPDGSGIDLLRWLAEAGVRVPVIVLTGQGDARTAVDLMKAGATDYMSKTALDAEAVRTRVPAAVRVFRAEQRLRETDERLRLATEAADVGAFELDVRTDRVTLSDRGRVLFGFEPGEPLARHAMRERVHPEDRPRVEAAEARALDPNGTGEYQAEFRVVQPEGSVQWLAARGRATFVGLGGERHPLRLVGAVIDVTQRRTAEEKARQESLHDALTGLPNRAYFRAELEATIARRRRDSGTSAVLFIDLDRFKLVNDSLGHQAGDELLVEVARRLRHSVRPDDFVSRLGGDEFTVLLREVSQASEASHAVARIQDVLRQPHALHGHEVVTSAAIGIAMVDASTAPDDVLRDADLAMDQAKRAGRAQSAHSEPARRRAAIERLVQETEIHGALERGEIVLHYQPFVRVADEAVLGLEALACWQHPRLGLLPPERLGPLAEETGQAAAIGRWALEEACEHVADWAGSIAMQRPLSLGVNVSPAQLLDPDFPFAVGRALAAGSLDHDQLHLGVSEPSLSGVEPPLSRRLRALTQSGVRLWLDDFGAGPGSLLNLRQLPVDAVKIDGSLVAGIPEDAASAAIVQAMVTLGSQLGIRVVAKGIETRAQLHALRDLGCAAAQGSLFGEPVPAEGVPSLLSAAPRG